MKNLKSRFNSFSLLFYLKVIRLKRDFVLLKFQLFKKKLSYQTITS